MKNRLDAYLAGFEITMYRGANVERLKSISPDQRDQAVDIGFFVGLRETRSPPAKSSLLVEEGGWSGIKPFFPRSARGIHPTASSFRIFCRCMRAHLRQIVNTFIHVRQWPSIVFRSNDLVDNETGAFSLVSCRTCREREGRYWYYRYRWRDSDETIPKFILLAKTSIIHQWTLVF